MNEPANPGFVRRRLLVAGALAAVLAASFLYAPYVNRGPVLCPLHGCAGLPCPSCGLTHGFCALARGDLAGALVANALALPLFAVFALAMPLALWELRLRRRCRLHALLYSRQVALPLLVALSAYHLARLGVWLADGTLYREYLTTSWTYGLLRGLGIF